MVGVPSPFGETTTAFDAYDEFVPANLPQSGPFLDGHDVLDGNRHLAVHRLARALFEDRGVYDMTFGYNLARLNNDPRHPGAGYRYAVEDQDAEDAVAGDEALSGGAASAADDSDDVLRVLRAEFTPTTAFCPQSDTLTTASFRAWNGLTDRHEFDLVRVRVAPMHQRATVINGELERLETAFRETGEVPESDTATVAPDDRATPETDHDGAGGGPTVPF
jgi:hypothetical protein